MELVEITASVFPPEWQPYEAQPILGQGVINQVWKLETPAGKMILRGNQGDLREFHKEAWCMERAAAQGARVSTLHSYGRIGSWNYMIQSCDGDENGEASSDKNELWRWMGREMRKVHDIRTPGFGYMLSDDKSGFTSRWRAYRDYCETLIDRAFDLVRPETQAVWTKSSLRDEFERMARTRYRFGLCHGDLKPGNTVLDHHGEPTLIDWGCAQANIVPHFEIGEIMRTYKWDGEEIRSFAEGYGLSGAELHSIRRDVFTVALMRAIDLLSWSSKSMPGRVDFYKSSFERLLAQPSV